MQERPGATAAESAPFRLDTSSGVPFYRQIVDQADGGRGRPPDTGHAAAHRPAARRRSGGEPEHGRESVSGERAYREMEIRGIVDTQQGTGTLGQAREAGADTSRARRTQR